MGNLVVDRENQGSREDVLGVGKGGGGGDAASLYNGTSQVHSDLVCQLWEVGAVYVGPKRG
ncbi:MAG: hypothetical protein JSW00_03460 [Thermoplasmata archaeon]|nr:MAG: hypothetical protein JSW00_03460 [Thermoplasmata archaeon]